jgi:hypothetical protein
MTTVYDEAWSLAQQKTIAIVPRISAAISILSSLYIVVSVLRSRIYRSRIFHRIMVGTALNVTFFSIWELWGTAAVPVGTHNVYGARGTEATCSAQGFLFQVFIFCVLSYYSGLSCYCFMAVRYNFDVQKYVWIEKWIHAGAYVYPICSAVYLLSKDAFHPTIHTCYIASVPLGCGDNGPMPCTKGPQNIGQLQWLLAGLPLIVLMFGSTCMTFFVYLELKRKNFGNQSEMTIAVKELALYLLALYWTFLPTCINAVLVFVMDSHSFVTTLVSTIINKLMGLWILLVFLQFRQVSSNRASEETVESAGEDCLGIDGAPTPNSKEKNKCWNSEATFSVFDGTNASKAWSEFVHDGDAEDEEEDEFESKRWECTVQT